MTIEKTRACRIGVRFRREVMAALPDRIPSPFDLFRIICFWNFHINQYREDSPSRVYRAGPARIRRLTSSATSGAIRRAISPLSLSHNWAETRFTISSMTLCGMTMPTGVSWGTAVAGVSCPIGPIVTGVRSGITSSSSNMLSIFTSSIISTSRGAFAIGGEPVWRPLPYGGLIFSRVPFSTPFSEAGWADSLIKSSIFSLLVLSSAVV